MSTPNPHEAAAREAKAQRLAHRAVEALINTANNNLSREAHDEFWSALLRNEPNQSASIETKTRVVAILRMLRPVKLEGWSL